MEVKEIFNLLRGEIVRVFNGKASVKIEGDKFIALKLNDKTGQHDILIGSYYNLDTAIIKIKENLK